MHSKSLHVVFHVACCAQKSHPADTEQYQHAFCVSGPKFPLLVAPCLVSMVNPESRQVFDTETVAC